MTTITPERWLPVPGWEQRYEVSDMGRVCSLWHRWGPRDIPLLLKPKTACADGKSRVVLCRGRAGKPVTRLVHHLVLEAFVGPRPDGEEARHGPGGARDNRLANLCWGTHSENVGADRVRDGTANRGERHGMARLTAANATEIRRRHAGGDAPRLLAEEFGVDRSTISNIVTGKAWAHLLSA